ncbi:MAG: ankyrin repeat domain-containing protein [Pseudomonadota bacterium]
MDSSDSAARAVTPPAAKGLTRARRSRWLVTVAAALALGITARLALSNDAGIHPAHLVDADLPEIERSLAGGTDPNARHIDGATALHHLVTVSADMGTAGRRMKKGKIYFAGQWGATGHLAVAEALLKAGADVNLQDSVGQTALHIAALTGHSEATRFLLANGADVNRPDERGRSAMDIARWTTTDEAIAEMSAATGEDISARAVRARASAVMQLLKAYGAR